MDELSKRYIPVFDPRFVKVVTKDGELAAFIVGIPYMTEGIRKARGRLFPFGFLHISRTIRKTKQLDFFLGAVKEKYRGRGLYVLGLVKMLIAAREAGYEVIDSHHEMESNAQVRAEMERLGGVVYKKYRVFGKML